MKTFYMWGFKSNEAMAMPEHALRANEARGFSPTVCGPAEVEPLLVHHPALQALWERIPQWIIRADLGRILLVYHHGGLYLDVDCTVSDGLAERLEAANAGAYVFTEKVLQSVDELGPREGKSPARKVRIANYAFGARAAKHPFFLAVVEEATKRLGAMLSEIDRGELTRLVPGDIFWVAGPDVITSVFHDTRAAHGDVALFEEGCVHNLAAWSWFPDLGTPR